MMDDHSQASQLVVGGLAHGFQFVDEKLSILQNQNLSKDQKIRRQNISMQNTQKL